MSEEEVKKLLSDIECDFWNLKNNIAYINKKQYHGLSRDLLDYIRDLEDRINKAVEHISNEFLCYDNESDEYIQGLKAIDLLKGDKE